MEQQLEAYLQAVNDYLHRLPLSERTDIIKEIKSSMLDMEADGKAPAEILQRLSSPAEMAKGYLGEQPWEGSPPRQYFFRALAFYSGVALSGLIVLPTLIVFAPTFLLSGALSVILGLAKWGTVVFHLPYEYLFQNIGVAGVLNPHVELLIILVLGLACMLGGYLSWKLLVFYCQKVLQIKRRLHV